MGLSLHCKRSLIVWSWSCPILAILPALCVSNGGADLGRAPETDGSSLSMLIHKLPRATDLCVIGGGAAGFYAAITCAERAIENGHASPDILVMEKSEKLLHKVSISGGGRCNVLHRYGVPQAASYPRGAGLMEHLSAAHGALDSAQWFESKGVQLKTEEDGRVFPASNTSKSIVDCFMSTASTLGIKVLLNTRAHTVDKTTEHFCVNVRGTDMMETSEGSQQILCRRLVICTGSAQKRTVQSLLKDAGAGISPVAPSLFSLQFSASTASKFQGLAGLAVPDAVVEIAENTQSSIPHIQGPLLITHGGISGPAILRLSAWGAYAFRDVDYNAVLKINWAPHTNEKDMVHSIMEVPAGREKQPPVRRKAVSEVSPWPGVLPARLWHRLLEQADVNNDLTSHLSQLSALQTPSCKAILKQTPQIPLIQWPWRFFGRPEAAQALAKAMLPSITQDQVAVAGRRVNKEEFVTAGGVDLNLLDWNRMELKSQPGVHFAGEALDVDGITGGFNFQGCWSSGYAAGVAVANSLCPNEVGWIDAPRVPATLSPWSSAWNSR